ncbi:nad kinase [Anaeramoeba ignava]|uniref:Nad kinase n=1 Tax=Anaeramoeba ignava TaxID=1746090 RepID=A0A9Q0L950_ANAIG|nr:nad kinase [Anaeramoeba ignava]
MHKSKSTKTLSDEIKNKYSIKFVNSHTKMPQTIIYPITPTKEIVTDSSQIKETHHCKKALKLSWKMKPTSVLVIKKRKDPTATEYAKQLIEYLTKELKVCVLIEPSAVQDLPNIPAFTTDERKILNQLVDFVICLGGDGTMLHISSLFYNQPSPPILAFHLGTLGFLAIFDFQEYKTTINSIMKGEFYITLRTRLTCQVFSKKSKTYKEFYALNEIVIDRGAAVFLASLECFCDDICFTTMQGDGVIISTPTGSTAYSLSAGGSMVHPTVPGILFTPICPHSLSNRPLIFPDCAVLTIRVAENSRGGASVFVDGRRGIKLLNGDYVIIRTNMYPLPSINRTDAIADWFVGLSSILHWNERVVQKAFTKNKDSSQNKIEDKNQNQNQNQNPNQNQNQNPNQN